MSISATPSAVDASSVTALDWPSDYPTCRRASAQNPTGLLLADDLNQKWRGGGEACGSQE